MVRQLKQVMAAALLAAAGGEVAAADAAPGLCLAACTAARAACRDEAYQRGHDDVAGLRRRAEPPLSTAEIASFMRRERERLGACEAGRRSCDQRCAAPPVPADAPPAPRGARDALPVPGGAQRGAMDASVHLSQR